MAGILRDIWVLTETGTVVFSRVFDETLKEQLFGMLMSAIQSFAEEISTGGLSNFEMSKKRFSILKRNHFLFIGSSAPGKKEKKVLGELENISAKFFQLYGKDLLNGWDGSIDIFETFYDEINSSVEKKVQNFLDNI